MVRSGTCCWWPGVKASSAAASRKMPCSEELRARRRPSPPRAASERPARRLLHGAAARRAFAPGRGPRSGRGGPFHARVARAAGDGAGVGLGDGRLPRPTTRAAPAEMRQDPSARVGAAAADRDARVAEMQSRRRSATCMTVGSPARPPTRVRRRRAAVRRTYRDRARRNGQDRLRA